MSKNYILLDGTSSSGKSTICEYFSTKNFTCIQIDNYIINNYNRNLNNLMKTIKNNYGELNKISDNVFANLDKDMVNDGIKIHNKTHKNILFDHVEPKGIIHNMKLHKLYDKLYIIIIFTNLDDLARNMVSRTKKGDSRGLIVFEQFSNRYIKCNNNDNKKIEIINRSNFKKILLHFFKYYFNNVDELNTFSNDIFNKMNIRDDKDHYIKLRDEFIYDYLLVTTNKTKEDIFNELDEKIKLINFNKNTKRNKKINKKKNTRKNKM